MKLVFFGLSYLDKTCEYLNICFCFRVLHSIIGSTQILQKFSSHVLHYCSRNSNFSTYYITQKNGAHARMGKLLNLNNINLFQVKFFVNKAFFIHYFYLFMTFIDKICVVSMIIIVHLSQTACIQLQYAQFL